jgi:cell division protein FtsN
MTDHDRGAYTPQTDAPLAFDARQQRGGGGGGRSPVALIISGIVLVLLIGAVFMFYRSGVRGANQPPQPVGTPVGAIKTPAPPEPKAAGEADALDVYKSADPTTPPARAPAFAPPPEKPMARPVPRPTLRVETSEIPPAGARLAVGPVKPQPVPPAAKPSSSKSPSSKSGAVQPKPEPKPGPRSIDDLAAVGPPPAPVAAQPKPTPSATASGPAVVQIGAFSTEDLAKKGWSDIASAFSADMAGKGRRVEAVAGSTLHRSLITGFASRDAAVAFCGKLKAAGKSCIVK